MVPIVLAACSGRSGEVRTITVTAEAPASQQSKPPPHATKSSAPPSAKPTTLQQAYEQAKPAIVRLDTQVSSEEGCHVSTGTGFAIDQDRVITAAHVVEGAQRLRVTNGIMTQPGEVVGVDWAKDIALIRVTTPLAGSATMSDSTPKEGDPVAVVGYAQGLGLSYRSGSVNALDRKVRVGSQVLTGMMELDAAAASGNSGGPVLAANGGVVGVLNAGPELAQGFRMAVPATTAKRLADRWADRTTPLDFYLTPCSEPPTPQSSEWPEDVPATKNLQSAAMTLTMYHRAVNDGDFPTADAQFAQPFPYEGFAEGLKSSVNSFFEVVDAGEENKVPWITMEFISEQDAGRGPRDRPDETCTVWHLKYTFAAARNVWLIKKAGQDGDIPMSYPCDMGD